ncbi:hypothetical protein [Xanthocytophaga agilis]|uniref:Tetratricopeptide repeat protein n=1 Tax=Xanthocytophaga agilis TaxID=3048010 RepID=A0AAE3UE36_9BACT|nr:hypothetical protein [Xanthocytophaga agilis]MDJ1502528.1 hypothetical protein [Xanthocytophaga agilis]
MINKKTTLATLTVCGVLALSGCTLNQMVKKSKEQKVAVTPNPLEVHADQVKFTAEATLPVKMLKKKTTYTGNIAYKYGDKKTDVGSIQFNAADYPNAKKESPVKSQEFNFPYQEDMRRGELTFTGTAAKGKKSKVSPELAIAQGIITTSRLAQDAVPVVYAETGYNPDPEYKPTYVAFYFDQGKSALKTSEVRSKRGKFLDAFIADKNVTKTVTVTGTHSPEGTERKNKFLSDDRAKQIEKFYRQKMKQYDYKSQADSVEFVLKPVFEDWTVLKDSVNSSTILQQEQKDQVLSIVDGGGEWEEKEKQLEKLAFWKTLFKQVYPKLRNANTEILTLVEKKTDAEMSAISKRIVEGKDTVGALSEAELAWSATLTPIVEEKQAIYAVAVKNYDSWQAHNDYAATQLEMAKKSSDPAKKAQLADDAITHLETAKTKQETAEVYSNLATAYTIKGDKQKAADAITKAQSLTGNDQVTKAINATKGVQQIRAAQYSEAAATLSQAGDDASVLYNKALAQLLAGQNDAAVATLNDAAAKDASNGDIYYLMAVANARAKKEADVFTNLQKAVQNKSSLREKAVDDLEFAAYKDSEGFKNSLK